MLPQYLEDKTEKRINLGDLDRELINFVSSPFTSSVCYFISLSSEAPESFHEERKDAARRVLSLIKNLERTFPPKPDTDVSGIEEIYQ